MSIYAIEDAHKAKVREAIGLMLAERGINPAADPEAVFDIICEFWHIVDDVPELDVYLADKHTAQVGADRLALEAALAALED